MTVFINEEDNVCFRDSGNHPIVPTGVALETFGTRVSEAIKLNRDQLNIVLCDIGRDLLNAYPDAFDPLYRMDKDILRDIKAERIAQIKEWGGEEHDDTNSENDWSIIFDRLSNKTTDHWMLDSNRRKELVKIAAVAIAAIESFDRLTEKEKANEQENKANA